MNKTLFALGVSVLGTAFASTTAPIIEEKENKGHVLVSVQAERPSEDFFKKETPVLLGAGIGYQTAVDEQAFINSYVVSLNSNFGLKTILPEVKTANADQDKKEAEEAAKEAPKYPSTKILKIAPTLKAAAIKYLDPTAENRVFVSAGGYATGSFTRTAVTTELEKKEEEKKAKTKTVATWANQGVDLGAVLGLGVELGEASGIVNTIKLEYFQPLTHAEMKVSEKKAKENKDGTPGKEVTSLQWNRMYKNLGTVALTYEIGF